MKHFKDVKSISRVNGAKALEEVSLGNGEGLVVGLNDSLYRLKFVLTIYVLIFTTVFVYILYRSLFELVLPIGVLVASTIIAWPVGEREVRTRVSMVPGVYAFRDRRIRVTIINQGDSTVIGELVLAVGWAEWTMPKRFRATIKFQGFGSTSLMWGTRLMESGDFIRVPESDIRDGLKTILHEMKAEDRENAKKYHARLLVLAINAKGLPHDAKPFKGLLSACDLGVDIADFPLDPDMPLPGGEARLHYKKVGTEMQPEVMELRTPPSQPSPHEVLSRISEQLDELNKQAGKKSEASRETSRSS
ncbi:MAG: hypothetical protein ABSG74_08650 [Candidatus Bathyarchaeia archaeon]|jgi:hypothetical protein